MLIHTAGNRQVREANAAPPGCRYIVRAISGRGRDRAQRWSYLDASRRSLSRRVEPEPAYDTRGRDWYRIAQGDGRSHMGKAYVFSSLKKPGITASRAFGDGVFGVDMTLSDIQGFLNEAAPSKRVGILLLEEWKGLLAASDGAASWLAKGQAELGEIGDLPFINAGNEWRDGRGKAWLRRRSDWAWGADTRLSLIVMSPPSDFSGYFDTIWSTLALFAAILFLVVSPIALRISAELSRPLAAIARYAGRVSAMDFGGESTRGSRRLTALAPATPG